MTVDAQTVAALEKAVAEKYGKDAVQDFRSEWKEEDEKRYLAQLEKRTKLSLQKEKPTHIIDDGEIEIKTHRTEKTQDRTCPVCKTYSFSPRDDLYMNRFKACRLCYYDFIFCREDDWMSGKRPTDEQISTCLRRRK
jgi:hypothetical protein